MDAAEVLEALMVWRGYEREFTTLLLYAVGIAIYTTVVFFTYDRVSRTEVFHSGKGKGAGAATMRFLESVFVLPVMSLVYWGVLAGALFLLAKTQTTAQILLLSLAVVVGVRATAFLSQAMAVDLARVVPLGLLGVLLVDPGYLTFEAIRVRFAEAVRMEEFVWRAFAFLVVLEATLRIVRGVLVRTKAHEKVPERVRRMVPSGPHAGPAARLGKR